MNNINICFIIILLLFFGLFMVNIKENFNNLEMEESNQEESNQEESNQEESNQEESNQEEEIANTINDVNTVEETEIGSYDAYLNNILSNHTNIIEESNPIHSEVVPESDIKQETSNIILPVSFSLKLPIEMSSNINLKDVRKSTINLLTTPPINLSNEFIDNISFRSGSIIIDITLNIDEEETYNKLKSLESQGDLFLTINEMKFKIEIFKPISSITEIDPRKPNLTNCSNETDPVCCLEPYNSNNYPYKTHKNICIAKAKGALENYCKIGKCDEKDKW